MVKARSKPKAARNKVSGGRSKKRDVILRTARKIFLEHGFVSTTTDMIQVASGVSKSTLYAHFPTKRILFETVCDTQTSDFEEGLKRAVQGLDEKRPRDWLLRFAEAFLDGVMSKSGLGFFRLLVAGARRFPDLSRRLYLMGNKTSSDMVEAYLIAAHAAGTLRVPHPHISAEHFLGMLRGEIHMRGAFNVGNVPSPAKTREYIAVTVDNFLAALAP
jgi:AcrR family transcriptional regulator